MNKEGDLKVWWIPQVPGKAFEVPVKSPEEAILIMDTLAQYDIFQLENNIKPDYSNTGGLSVFEDADWSDWHHPETGEDIDEWKESMEETTTEVLIPQSKCKADGCNADYLKDTHLVDAAADGHCDDCWIKMKSKDFSISEGISHLSKMSGDHK